MLPVGETASVYEMLPNTINRDRLLDLGLVKNTKIKSLQKSPSGDPIAYYIRGSVIALRSEDANNILVSIN